MTLNRQRSYYEWGLEELAKRMDDRCEVGYDQYDVICEFIHDMERLACLNPINSIKFSCAADAGKYVLESKIPHYI